MRIHRLGLLLAIGIVSCGKNTHYATDPYAAGYGNQQQVNRNTGADASSFTQQSSGTQQSYGSGSSGSVVVTPNIETYFVTNLYDFYRGVYASVANAYEGSNPASRWQVIDQLEPLGTIQLADHSRVFVRMMGNVNWNGCALSGANFQFAADLTFDDSTTPIQIRNPGVQADNGGTDWSLSKVVAVPTSGSALASELRVTAKVRYQLRPGMAGTCITEFGVFTSTLEVQLLE